MGGGRRERRALVPLEVLVLQVVLRTLDGIAGVLQREHGVRMYSSAFAQAALSFPTFDSL